MKLMLGHYPAGTSLNVLFHFLQQIADQSVTAQFDYYDESENLYHYGKKKPEPLDLSPLKTLGVPISLFVGQNDILST